MRLNQRVVAFQWQCAKFSSRIHGTWHHLYGEEELWEPLSRKFNFGRPLYGSPNLPYKLDILSVAPYIRRQVYGPIILKVKLVTDLTQSALPECNSLFPIISNRKSRAPSPMRDDITSAVTNTSSCYARPRTNIDEIHVRSCGVLV